MTFGISKTPRPQVLSIPERLDADPDARGRGVVIAFVDMGFHPHPDLMRPDKRILAYVDAAREEPVLDELLTPNAWAWHGTMAACVAAGSGYLSGGRYRGLASEAGVVLVKCSDAEHRIRGKHVAHAIRLPLRHPEMGVRVLNVSVGVDLTDPDVDDVLAAVREVTRAGVLVLAAAGNREGAAMFQLVSVLEEHLERAELAPPGKRLDDRDRASIAAMLAAATDRVGHQKFVSPDYQHVDGTSFAAPITASVAAQMLEVDPSLTPALLREGLLATARRVREIPNEQQGAGLLRPAAAVAWAKQRLRYAASPR
jgi:subtilisin family serine protease